VNVAVVPEYDTFPGTAVFPCINVNVVVLIVAGFIASLKENEIILLRGTPVALASGSF
jgi:hypothetical protein